MNEDYGQTGTEREPSDWVSELLAKPSAEREPRFRLPEVSGRWAGATDDERALILNQAHAEAIVEYVSRNLVARGADPIDELPAHYRHMTLAEVEAGFAAYDALPAADDGPGRDTHGPHDAATVAQRLAEAAAEMTSPTVTVEHPVSAHQGDAELEVRVCNTIAEHIKGHNKRRFATRQIIAAVRSASTPRYTDRLTLHADDLDVPVDGPRWQVLDAKDQQTWHDLDAITECELGEQCPIAASLPSDVECIVLIGTAWGDGFAHTPADAMIDVRIPAAVTA
jgi:hypothetical protein